MSLRPSIPQECRRALTSPGTQAASEHEVACSFCSARAAARRVLAGPLQVRPKVPAELALPGFLESVYERTVQHGEQDLVAEWLHSAPMPEGQGDVSWDRRLQTSAVASELVRRPASPDAAAWSRVRREIVAGVAAPAPVSRSASGRWSALLAGAAAAAIIAAISVSDGTQSEPRIVFTELADAPDVPFAVVRYGARD